VNRKNGESISWDQKPARQLQFDVTLVSHLACPACLSDLHPEEVRLVCTACGRGYPVVDGIPVLIVERAEASQARGDQTGSGK
jgi:uncharacterized protein YbaR (Trm112 family)